MKSPRIPNRLFHFTCEHGADGIAITGAVMPLAMIEGAMLELVPEEIKWRSEFAWFTDDPSPERLALGLTSYHLLCDRMAVRFEVDPPASTKWWPSLIPDLGAHARELSLSPGATPGRWWVAPRPARVVTIA